VEAAEAEEGDVDERGGAKVIVAVEEDGIMEETMPWWKAMPVDGTVRKETVGRAGGSTMQRSADGVNSKYGFGSTIMTDAPLAAARRAAARPAKPAPTTSTSQSTGAIFLAIFYRNTLQFWCVVVE
jgi:hypothetical protein